MEDESKVPISDLMGGHGVAPLDEGETVLEAFILIKVLDQDGDVGWSFRTTSRLNREELLGALQVQVDVLRRRLRDEWWAD